MQLIKGDKVVLIGKNYPGETGTIIRAFPLKSIQTVSYVVQLDRDINIAAFRSELQPTESLITRIIRRIVG